MSSSYNEVSQSNDDKNSSNNDVSQSIDDKKSFTARSIDSMKSSIVQIPKDCLDFWKNGSIEMGREVFKRYKI